ncbi:MAG: DUF2017 family protein [Acidimicrobiia bacterium]
MTHFKATRGGIRVMLGPEERIFLGDVLPMLAGIGAVGSDPAADRFHVPVYLDDPEADSEWWRLMGGDLEAARRAGRAVLQRVLDEFGNLTLDEAEANALLRVINEARLALGARLGIDVESDHDELSEDSRQVLDYLGWLLEELTIALSQSL